VQEVSTPTVKETHGISSITIVSDNAGSFSSYAHIPFVHSLNQQPNKFPKTKAWLYFEVQCGKSMLDTHFCFINVQLKRALLNNVKYTEQRGLFDALSFDGGIRGTTVLLVTKLHTSDAIFETCKQLIESQPSGFHKDKRSTHALNFTNINGATLHTQTGLATQKCASVDGWPTKFHDTSKVESINRSADFRPLRLKPKRKQQDEASGDNQQKQQRFSTFLNVLEDSINETIKNRESNLDKSMLPKSHPSNADNPTQSQHQQHRYPVSDPFISKRWAAKASRNWVESDPKIKATLTQFFLSGVEDKKCRVTADVATRELKSDALKYCWDKRCIYTTAKIKSFFSSLLTKQKKEAKKATHAYSNTTPSATIIHAIVQPPPMQAENDQETEEPEPTDEENKEQTDENEQIEMELHYIRHAIESIQFNEDDVVYV
jgi:hypothetical protein